MSFDLNFAQDFFTLFHRMSDACTLLKDPEVCSSISTDEAIQLCYTFKVSPFFAILLLICTKRPFLYGLFIHILADNAGAFGCVE